MSKAVIDKVTGNRDLEINVPASKSILARAMILSALSNGKCVLKDVVLCEDTRMLLLALRDLGFSIYYTAGMKTLRIYGEDGYVPKSEASVYVGNSGTAARFLIAMLGLSDGTYVVNGSEQLSKRPMDGLVEALRNYGATVTCSKKEGCLPVTIKGRRPMPGEKLDFKVDVSKSTQFASGLLMALSCLPNESTVTLVSKSRDSYIHMTESLITKFGGRIKHDADVYHVLEGAPYSAMDLPIEPDLSGACYFYAAAALTGSRVIVNGVSAKTLQNDIRFLEFLGNFGAKVSYRHGEIEVSGTDDVKLSGNVTLDMGDYSDQTATACVLGAFMKGTLRIENISHINHQESHRISVICDNLKKCGIECKEGDDYIIVKGGKPKGANIHAHGDHRIAMAFSVLGLVTGNMRIADYDCVGKSFEGFFDELKKFSDCV